MTVDPSVLAGFGATADAYERGRPGYPPEAVSWLAERLGLAPGACVLDLAAGTGKLTRELVGTGARVIAVEPSDGMRAELARVLPEVEVLAGMAEEIPLPDGPVDAVTVAQAFHWFASAEALAEIARVLRPGGGLGLVWNHYEPGELYAQLKEILDPLRPDAHRHASASWPSVVEASPLFGPLEEAEFPHVHATTADELADRVGSVSFVSFHPGRAELLERVRELAGGGEVSIGYRTRAYVTRAGA